MNGKVEAKSRYVRSWHTLCWPMDNLGRRFLSLLADAAQRKSRTRPEPDPGLLCSPWIKVSGYSARLPRSTGGGGGGSGGAGQTLVARITEPSGQVWVGGAAGGGGGSGGGGGGGGATPPKL